MNPIHQNLQNITTEIQSLNAKTTLIAVSKTFPIESITDAYKFGIRKFGENYPQELAEKSFKLKEFDDIEWHFIGNIQSNKTKLIAEHATWVHTITKYQHAKRLNDQRPQGSAKLKVLIEVNISNEESKHGLNTLEQIKQLASEIQQLPNLELRGLMGMASDTEDENLIKQQFLTLANYREVLNNMGFNLNELSMGMSHDYQITINCGATLVRIGSKIFGVRNYDN